MTTADGLGELFNRSARALRRDWVAALVSSGLSPHQARALRVLVAEGPLRLGSLAESLRIAPRSATDVADALEGQDLLRRRPDPADRRAVVVEATAHGREVSAQVEALRHTSADRYFERLSATDRSELVRILTDLDGPSERPVVP